MPFQAMSSTSLRGRYRQTIIDCIEFHRICAILHQLLLANGTTLWWSIINQLSTEFKTRQGNPIRTCLLGQLWSFFYLCTRRNKAIIMGEGLAKVPDIHNPLLVYVWGWDTHPIFLLHFLKQHRHRCNFLYFINKILT